MRRSALIITAVFSAMLLCACSTKLAYNFMDWGIEWKVRSFVSLHGPQKDNMKLAVTRFHQWHRNTQLPEYANYLEYLANRILSEPFTGAQIHAETDRVQLLIDRSLEQVLPEIVALLRELDDQQVAQLLKNVRKQTAEYVDEYVKISEAKLYRRRYDDFVDYFKPWIGSLSNSQKNQIRHWSETLLAFEALSVDQQNAWADHLTKALANRKNGNLEAELRELMFYRTDNWSPQLEKILDQNQIATYQLIADLLNGLSADQKHHLLDELRDYSRICRELAANS